MALSKGSSLSAGGSGGGGAMELISTTNVAGANIIDIQSGFTSTYDNYVVIAAGISVSNNNDNIYMKVYKNGALLTTANYQYYSESGATSSNQAEFRRMCYVGGADCGWTVNLTNANSRFFSIKSNGYYRGVNLGMNTEATSGVVTGIQFLCQTSSVSFTAGTVKLYGIKK